MPHTLALATALALTLTALPLAAQSLAGACPAHAIRINDACIARGGAEITGFNLPQIEDTRIYDLSADGPFGIAPDEEARVVVEEDSRLFLDPDVDLTVITE